MTETQIRSIIESETPRVRKVTLANYANIPAELQAVKQWVVYRFDPREGKKEPGGYSSKLGKPPVSPSSGNPLSWKDPKKFLSFDQAVKALRENKPGNLAGIGIVFTGAEPFSGVDIDSCIDQGGNPKPAIQDVIDRLNSYTEVSPSGKGVRVIGLGKLPEGDGGGKQGNFEAYSKDRFLTITGNTIGGRNKIRDFSSDLAWFQETFTKAPTKEKPATPPREQQAVSSSGPLSDDDILKMIPRAANGAKIQALMSENGVSEDNAALVGCLSLYTKDPYQIERLIRSSGKVREKWDQKRGKDNFLVYDIKRLLKKYPTPDYEPKSNPREGGVTGSPSVDSSGLFPAEIDPRKIYNPNRTTDMGNSERLFELAGKDLRYIRDLGWYIWQDGRWVADEMAVRELFKSKVVSQIYNELAEKAIGHDPAGVKELASWAKRTEAERQIQGGLAMAASMPGIYIKPADLDRDPWLLNVQNGTLDLKTGKLREHRREDVFTKICPVKYDPTATAPTWEAFLHRVMDGKQDLVDFLRRAIGYSLTGSVQAQCWFIAHGVGANGKGTFLNTILQLMGDYATQAAPDLLMMAKGDASRHPTEQADLFGKRLAVCQETEEGRRLAEVAVKQMTGGDRIKARLMRKDFFEFDPTHKLWLATNHKPVIRDTTVSTWRRIRMIPFSVVIPEAERDDTLPEKLKAELPGILRWAVEGCLEWQKDGLKPPVEVTAATTQYRESQDILSAFIAECCFIPKSAPWALKTSAKNLYAAYCQWCEDSGERPKSQTRFGEALTERGFMRVRGGTGAYVYEGIGLSDSEHSEHSEPLSGITTRKQNTKPLISESGSDHSDPSDNDDQEEIQ